MVITILGYLLWAMVAIFCIIVVFDLLSCMGSGGGVGSGPHLFGRP